MKAAIKKPKILVLDIETSPLLSYTWGIFDQNVSLNQIHTDWSILSWAAKWVGDHVSKVMYMDQRNAKNLSNDKIILEGIWKLLDEADIVLTQNGKKFDIKKLNARFVIHGLQPPSSFRQLDTLQIARKSFGFTSNKLEYMTKTLNTKYKKLSHSKFSGFELWKECLKGNKAAWKEMEIYNKHDVLATEELFTKLSPWDTTINLNVYSDDGCVCSGCGKEEFVRNGFVYTNYGKYQRWKCLACGAETKDRNNVIPTDRRKRLRTRTR